MFEAALLIVVALAPPITPLPTSLSGTYLPCYLQDLR